MTIKLLKDLDFANKLSVAEPVTEAAQSVVRNYRGYLYMNPANCTVVNNFIREAQQYGYDKGMSQILDSVQSFVNENRISWALATACESIAANNSTYSYIAKLGISKVEKLLEMNESDVIAYIKAGALKGVKYIPEFREICKEVYKSQISESVQTVNYEMHTPFSYTIVEGKDTICMIGGKAYRINENHVEETECNDVTFNRVNAHLTAFKQVGEAIEYKYGDITFSINEDKLTVNKGESVLGVFESNIDFLKFADTYSRAIVNGRQFMTIAGAVGEVFENCEGISIIDMARQFNCTNGTSGYIIEAKDNVISVANGNKNDSVFMIDALQNINENCGIDVKVIYESRINEDMKKGNPEQYAAINEELQKTKDAQAEIRYRKIEQLAESLKDNPAAIAVLNSVTKELRMLDESRQTNVNENVAGQNMQPKNKNELRELIEQLIKERGDEADLNDIDVSKITDMSQLFNKLKFNGDISKWDVSNVKDMSYMFCNTVFNGDISSWNVSNVEDMSGMFYRSKFNGDISKWDVSNVTNMYGMFADSEFNVDISKWDVSNVVRMIGMFRGSKFNGDISKWDVSNVKDMEYMFDHSPLEKNPPKWYKK